jgi:hypothetical protein
MPNCIVSISNSNHLIKKPQPLNAAVAEFLEREKLGRCPKPRAPRAKTFLERKVLDSKELKTGSEFFFVNFLWGRGPTWMTH